MLALTHKKTDIMQALHITEYCVTVHYTIHFSKTSRNVASQFKYNQNCSGPIKQVHKKLHLDKEIVSLH